VNDHAKGLVLGRERLRRSIFYEIGKNRARIRFLSRVRSGRGRQETGSGFSVVNLLASERFHLAIPNLYTTDSYKNCE